MSVTLATVVPLPVRPPAEPNCWADVRDVIDRVETLLDDGDPAEVVDLCQWAVTYLEDSASEIAQSGAAYEVAERLGALHLRACRAARPAPLGLARWLFATEFRGDLGAVAGGAEAYADVLGPAGLAEYRRLADNAWRGPCHADRFRLRRIMTSVARATHPSAV